MWNMGNIIHNTYIEWGFQQATPSKENYICASKIYFSLILYFQ